MIEWEFIAALEGGRELRGYVPAVGTSDSGVTIATGVDLGARTAKEIDNWPLTDPALKERLKAYADLKGAAAAAKLEEMPLVISEKEAIQIETAAAGPIFDAVRDAYDKAVGENAFQGLPDEAQTVLASLAYQYGPNLAKRTPNFWRLACQGDWQACVDELENFGDRYPPRRRKEAALLRAVLAPNPNDVTPFAPRASD